MDPVGDLLLVEIVCKLQQCLSSIDLVYTRQPGHLPLDSCSQAPASSKVHPEACQQLVGSPSGGLTLPVTVGGHVDTGRPQR